MKNYLHINIVFRCLLGVLEVLGNCSERIRVGYLPLHPVPTCAVGVAVRRE